MPSHEGANRLPPSWGSGEARQVTAGPLEPAVTPHWRLIGIGLLRIVFGGVWALDAWFKWQPDFISGFSQYLTDAQQLDNQPAAVRGWIGFWVNTVSVSPHVFAHFVAVAETLVAIGLIFGVLSNLTYVGGALLSAVIWSTAESFGGPYSSGSTDIGAAIIYVLVFIGLFLASAGHYLGLDTILGRKLGRLSWLASGRTAIDETETAV